MDTLFFFIVSFLPGIALGIVLSALTRRADFTPEFPAHQRPIAQPGYIDEGEFQTDAYVEPSHPSRNLQSTLALQSSEPSHPSAPQPTPVAQSAAQALSMTPDCCAEAMRELQASHALPYHYGSPNGPFARPKQLQSLWDWLGSRPVDDELRS